MATPLIQLLQPRTVLIKADKSVGTGSLIANGKVLTCAHVVRQGLEKNQQIEVSLPDPDNPGKFLWSEIVNKSYLSNKYEEKSKPNSENETLLKTTEYPDVAVLEININNNKVIKLPDPDHQLTQPENKQFVTFGFQKKDRQLIRNIPESVNLNYNGEEVDGIIRKLRFTNGIIRPGMSGAPLMNLETGEVEGLVHMTINPNNDLGAIVIPIQMVWHVFKKWNDEKVCDIYQILNSNQHKKQVKEEYRVVYPKWPMLKLYGRKLLLIALIMFFGLWWFFFHRGPIEESSVIAILLVLVGVFGNLLGNWLGTDVNIETTNAKNQIGILIFNKYILSFFALVVVALWFCSSSIWVHGNSQEPTTELSLFKGAQEIKKAALNPKGISKLTFFALPWSDSVSIKVGDREAIPLSVRSLDKSEFYYPSDFLLEPLIFIRFDGAHRRLMKNYILEVTIENIEEQSIIEEILYVDSTLNEYGSVFIGKRELTQFSEGQISPWKETVEKLNLSPEVQEIWFKHWRSSLNLAHLDLNIKDRVRIRVTRKSDNKELNEQRYSIQNDFSDKYLEFKDENI